MDAGMWADDSHLSGWLIAEMADNPQYAASEDVLAHLKGCPACDVLLRQAEDHARDAGDLPALSIEAGGNQLPDMAALPGVLVSNLIARQAPEFAVGQVWQLVGTRHAELVALTKPAESGAFVIPLTSDPPELTDPYTIQVGLRRSGIQLAAWVSLETFVYAEVFSTHLDDIDTNVVATGRAAWRHGEPAKTSLLVGSSTEGRPDLAAYREQLQQRITSLAYDQLVADDDADEGAAPAHVILQELGVKTARVREALGVDASVAGAILSGDRSLSANEARVLSESLGVEIPPATVAPDPRLVAAVAAPRRRVIFQRLAALRDTDEWVERRVAIENQLSLAARTSSQTAKWDDLLDQYLLHQIDAAKAQQVTDD
jgi:hypothetical protein